MNTTADTLRRAKAHLIEIGWQRGSMGRRGWPCCAYGAVCAVRRSDKHRSDAHAALLAVLKTYDYRDEDFAYGEFPVRTITGYNDHPDRKYTQVLALFEQAILATGSRG